MIKVDWSQAKAYCEWRGSKLPSEAQWEKAARGGLEGQDYPWGNAASDCTRANFQGKNNYNDYCVGDTTKVGSYPANGYGLFDMAGNVWEWVADWYSESYYAASPSQNPLGPDSGQYRVLRGGSWGSEIIGASALPSRGRGSIDDWKNGIGFRCARLP